MLPRYFSSRAVASSRLLSRAPRMWQSRSPASPTIIQGQQPRVASFVQHRFESSSTPRPLSDRQDQAAEPNAEREEVPQYEMTFTCRKCLDRSSHRISKQAYHHGTTLITCPGCKNRHLISDHLKIFSDKSITLEDLLKEKGQFLKKGSLSAEGDVEFWDDGTETKRT
ncbi:hypothetical protein KVT40_003294 [Elsinoe batatas]|uniref:DNL-type domain-containing protein n=1 Tax=Elsinoe batatas TaxID=2601811 RepID=A0A8K0PL08_9PEZI|nr:hypothetical protein KVT40_003294 [Elsinoe batatas]